MAYIDADCLHMVSLNKYPSSASRPNVHAHARRMFSIIYSIIYLSPIKKQLLPSACESQRCISAFSQACLLVLFIYNLGT